MYEFAAISDTGRVRTNNEDAVIFDENTSVAVLADGMGGYNAGEIASKMATEIICTNLSAWLVRVGGEVASRDIRRAMETSVDLANRTIFDTANTDPECFGMGTTLVMGVFQPGRVLIGHVGDSRCYRMRKNNLVQITHDHSLLQEQIDSGLITLEQASVSNSRNLVTRALGVEDAVLLDVGEHRVDPGDLFMMCSDGLPDMVDDIAIADLLAENMPLKEKAATLVAAANSAGGRDNISVLLVQAGQTGAKRGLLSRWLGR